MGGEQTAAEKLDEVEWRLHVVEGLVLVLDHVDRFVEVVLAGTNPSDTVRALRRTFGLSELQALAALDMQFRRLGQESQAEMRSSLDELRAERERHKKP